jgi:hypothetical protein
MAAARSILESLASGDEVFGTDAVTFDRDHIVYWSREGIEYLRMNFEAARRGVVIRRVFIVRQVDRERHADLLEQLCKLQESAGVTPLLATYEELPPTSRYEFALLGSGFVDEVIYDMMSNQIIDNYIHWSEHKRAAFRERANVISHYADAPTALSPAMASRFQGVVELARNFGREIKKNPL